MSKIFILNHLLCTFLGTMRYKAGIEKENNPYIYVTLYKATFTHVTLFDSMDQMADTTPTTQQKKLACQA